MAEDWVRAPDWFDEGEMKRFLLRNKASNNQHTIGHETIWYGPDGRGVYREVALVRYVRKDLL